MPLISICIPTYKNIEFLQRLLNSIITQTFKDYEVIITDDCPDDTIEKFVSNQDKLTINYYKNNIALGTPANWNYAISKATGKWIKLMHDDDWFANEISLQAFANTALMHPSHDLIFSGFTEVKDYNKKNPYIISTAEQTLLKKSSLNLFKKNFIGHPSTTLIKNNKSQWYDEKIKWVVDFEFYIRCLNSAAFTAIKKPLINIGIHNEQVTKKVFRKPEIEIPENLYLINKIGTTSLKNIFVYDYYWRLFRNLNLRSLETISLYAKEIQIPFRIKKMLQVQFKIPLRVLKIGVFSKIIMIVTKMFA